LVLGGSAALILIALVLCACRQTSYWRNSETLWTHTTGLHLQTILSLTIIWATNSLEKASWTKRSPITKTALQINPDYAEAHYNLAEALLKKGSMDEAIFHYQAAFANQPRFTSMPANNLGNALMRTGRVDEAITHYEWALQSKPDSAAPTSTSATFSSEGAGRRSHHPLPGGVADQPNFGTGPLQPEQGPVPKRRGGRSDHPLPKGGANQPRLRNRPESPAQPHGHRPTNH